jgi:serine/threonine protein kinase
MNRSVDSRSDLYALGVTLYQRLTGVLPFVAGDPMEWVHCHIARQPLPQTRLVATIPAPLSAIVMKLLAKMAEERYQSAWGLKTDLEKCLRGLSNDGSIPEFKLGMEDSSDQLRIPEKLYGRKEGLDRLLHAFDRIGKGERELLLVAGYSGVGKTRLVREIHKTVIEKQGYLIEGKFEQLQRNVPYFAWVQAFDELVNYLLMGSEPDLAQWREKRY